MVKLVSFPIEGEVDLKELDTTIAAAMGWFRHAGIEDKNCFCGLIMSRNELGATIQVVWTDDGENGYVKDLSEEDALLIQNILNIYRK